MSLTLDYFFRTITLIVDSQKEITSTFGTYNQIIYNVEICLLNLNLFFFVIYMESTLYTSLLNEIFKLNYMRKTEVLLGICPKLSIRF